MKNFADFQLPEALLVALQGISFNKPTEIQSKAIPHLLQGRDLIASAQTGTGKTGAYLIPILARLMLSEGLGQALILVPTRELALQVQSVLSEIQKNPLGIRAALLIGGVNLEKQIRAVSQSPQLIIATPGRLVDLLAHRVFNLDQIQMLVLDEADRMLDMGFMPQIQRVMGYLPRKKQTVLFSATFPKEIEMLAKQILYKPERIFVGQASRAQATIKQTARELANKEKEQVILDELNSRKGSILIFVRTKQRTDRLFQHLKEYGYDVECLHGDRTQGQRNSAMKGFREGRCRILVATDVASRGLDIEQVEHVINYDLPESREDYIHRIGRTGRQGRFGQALTFFTPEEKKQWQRMSNSKS